LACVGFALTICGNVECASSLALNRGSKLPHSIIIPKGLRHIAQGRGACRYPGNDGKLHFNPNGVAAEYVQAEKQLDFRREKRTAENRPMTIKLLLPVKLFESQ